MQGIIYKLELKANSKFESPKISKITFFSQNSGGPLVCNSNGKAVLTGVTSGGYGCAKPRYPGVYARVTHVLDWIKSNMVGLRYSLKNILKHT